ncbi:MAG: hypothetical protein ACXVA9_03990 [Bdellovibrionales bacterium]
MEGLSLLKLLIESTGLPPEAVERELNKVLAKGGFQREQLTLDDVRELLSIYLQDVLVEAKESALTDGF